MALISLKKNNNKQTYSLLLDLTSEHRLKSEQFLFSQLGDMDSKVGFKIRSQPVKTVFR